MPLTAQMLVQAFEESGITTKRQVKRLIRQLAPMADQEVTRKVERLIARREQLAGALAEVDAELVELQSG